MISAEDIISDDLFLSSEELVNLPFSILLLICCISGLLISRVFLNNTVSASVVLFADIAVYYISKWFVFNLLGVSDESIAFLLKITLPSAGLTFLVGVPIFLLVRWCARKLVKK